MSVKQQHRLATVMFTDIVGYTALLGKDEERAVEIHRENRQKYQPLIKRYKGHWLKETE